MIYETAPLTLKQAKSFCDRFDTLIGTERELNSIDLDTYYVCCFELETKQELKICRRIELKSL